MVSPDMKREAYSVRRQEKLRATSSKDLQAEFLGLGCEIEKNTGAFMIYCKCNSMRAIWHELETRGEEPMWPGDPRLLTLPVEE